MRSICRVSAVWLLCLLLGTQAVFADDSSPGKLGDDLVAGGVGIFALTYVPSAAVALASHGQKDMALLIPAAGPWVALGSGGHDGGARLALGFDGALQGAGVALAVSGLILKAASATPDEIVYISTAAKNVEAGKRGAKDAAKTGLLVSPAQVGASGYGVGVAGTF